MHTINQELARLRRDDLLRAAAADRFASLARRAAGRRQVTTRTRRSVRSFAGGTAPSRVTQLARVPLFQGLSRRDLRVLAQHADLFTAPEGSVLARETQPEPQFVVIGHGIAEATREGHRVAMHAAGDHFGELTLLEGTPQVPTVVALTDVTGYVFGRRSFWDALNAVPTLAVRLATRLAEDLARSQRAMASSDQYRARDSSDPDTCDEGELCGSLPSSSSAYSA